MFIFLACKTNSEKTSTADDVEKNTSIQDPETNTPDFEILQSPIPEKAGKTLIVVTDPHGNGKLALSKFEKLAETFDCTIIGLNNVKNNTPDFIKKTEKDIETAKRILNINPEYLFTAGFSGGARMALIYASTHKTNGVLMCGAGINTQNADKLNFPLAEVSGTEDFNFSEQYYSPFSPLAENKNIANLIFDGKHEWPPQEYILFAFTFLSERNNLKINTKKDFMSKANRLLYNKQYLKAFRMYEAAYKTGNNEAEKKIADLYKNKNFRNYITKYEELLKKETERNKQYIKYIIEKNTEWWRNEVLKLNKLIKTEKEPEATSLKRTKAFLGIALYSLTEKEISDPWSKNIDKFLQIYEYLEPENPDLWFFNAVRQEQKNNKQLSRKYLKRAFAFGFSDSVKIKNYGLNY